MPLSLIVFFIVFFYLFLPTIFEGLNYIMWKTSYFLLNYIVAIILATLFFYFKADFSHRRENMMSILLAPLIYWTLYKLFDTLKIKLFGNHLIILNRSMSKKAWQYNWLDIIGNVIIHSGSVLLSLMPFR